jgi:VanZ family protein
MTPLILRNAARAALAVAAPLACYLLFWPETGVVGFVAHLLPWDKAIHFIGFYGLTVLTFLSFPGHRRHDLAFGLVLLGMLSELVQGVVGRDCDFGDFVADTLAVLAVLGPIAVENLRRLCRSHGAVAFGAIGPQVERRAARGGERPAQPSRATS